jgi:predicted transposase YbfD/YdcC
MTEKIALMTHFVDVNDPRRDQGKRHLLSDMLPLTICAVLSGANTWVEIEEYGESKHDWLKTFLSLPHGIPSHDTLSDIFARLNPAELEAGFQRWVSSIAATITDAQLHIDGKVLRGSGDTPNGKKPLHLVSAWVSEVNLILGQVKTDDKSNEITAIPELLKVLILEGALVTIDAMGTQTDIAEQIVQQGGDYLLAVKGNHKTMLQDLDDLFAGCDAVEFVDVTHDTAETVNKGHGRIEIRRCQTLADPQYLDYIRRQTEWKNLTTLVRIQRERRINDRVTTETAYFISSRSASAAYFLEAVRGHWAIENQLHWSLDVTFREDHNQTRTGFAAENLALIRRLALMLLKRETSVKVGLQAKRLRAGWHNDYLLKVLNC